MKSSLKKLHIDTNGVCALCYLSLSLSLSTSSAFWSFFSWARTFDYNSVNRIQLIRCTFSVKSICDRFFFLFFLFHLNENQCCENSKNDCHQQCFHIELSVRVSQLYSMQMMCKSFFSYSLMSCLKTISNNSIGVNIYKRSNNKDSK